MRMSWGTSGAILLAAGVSIGIGWSLSPAQDSGEPVADVAAPGLPQRRETPAVERIPAPPSIRLASDVHGGDPFAPRDWLPPAPPPVVVAAPPPPPPASSPPVVPPLPFAFVGAIEDGPGGPKTFVSANDALFVVSTGDVLEGLYKVESISPNAIVFIHLPTGERQTLSLSPTP